MTRSLAVAIGVVVLLFAGAAEAKIRVAVVAFEGDDNGAVQEVVTDLLDGDYSVSGTKAVNRTVDKLGLDANMSDKDLKKLANELEVDAILRGDLTKKGARKLLHVKVYLKGKKVRGFKVEFASVKSEKFKSALKDKIDEKLSGQEAAKKQVDEAPAEAAADEEDPIGGKKKGKKGAKTDMAAEKAALKTKSDAPAEEEATEKTENEDGKSDEEKQSGDEEDPEGKAKKKVASADADEEDVGGVSKSVTVEKSSGGRSANTVAFRLDVGPSISSRKLVFNSRVFEEAPKPYANNPVGGMRVGGELYPLAFANPHSFISGLGFAGHYDQTLKLNLESSVQIGTKFPVTQRNWSVGARFRIAFGSSARAPTVTLGGGYFHRNFSVNRSQLMTGNIIDLPDVLYKGYDPGIEFRIPIIKQVALMFGGQLLLVTDTGQIQQLNQYGQAKVTSGQGMAGLDIVIANRVGVKLAAEMAQFGFAFTGNGDQTFNRDKDPATPDVGGAADRYYGGSFTLGVLY
ncbi:MAG TPA: hypothetical protein VFV99_01790 [Kofleriaceae bacterium]|nr:hypothetical protein [Kofleriaceae bacterium]